MHSLDFLFSAFELSAEKSRGGEDELLLDLGIGTVTRGRLTVGDRCHTANDVARTDDRHGTAYTKVASVCQNGNGLVVRSVAIKGAGFDDLLQLFGKLLVVIFLFGHTRAGDDRITVADHDRQRTHLMERFRILRGKRRKLSDRGILFENDLTLAVGINFERVSFTDNIDTDRSLLFSYAGAVEKGWDES